MAENLENLAPDLVSFLPPEIAHEIGNSTVAFSLVEDSLNALIGELLNAGDVAGQAVTFTIRNITDRIELARTLVKDKMKNGLQEETLEKLNRVVDVNTRRNTLIHHALTTIRYNVEPGSHVLEYRKKDHLIRKTSQRTILKSPDFKALTTDLRLLFRALDGATTMYKLARARAAKQSPSPQTPAAPVPAPQDHTDTT